MAFSPPACRRPARSTPDGPGKGARFRIAQCRRDLTERHLSLFKQLSGYSNIDDGAFLSSTGQYPAFEGGHDRRCKMCESRRARAGRGWVCWFEFQELVWAGSTSVPQKLAPDTLEAPP
jgi:hypothetical protein